MQKIQLKCNAYDPCIYNKRTKDEAINISAHVDDSKFSTKSDTRLAKWFKV